MVPSSPRTVERSSWRIAAALADARSTLHLTPAEKVLEEWRRRAVLQSDPDAFRRSVRRAAKFFTGDPAPEDEPYEITRARAGM